MSGGEAMMVSFRLTVALIILVVVLAVALQ